jgi:hypothetical protein
VTLVDAIAVRKTAFDPQLLWPSSPHFPKAGCDQGSAGAGRQTAQRLDDAGPASSDRPIKSLACDLIRRNPKSAICEENLNLGFGIGVLDRTLYSILTTGKVQI